MTILNTCLDACDESVRLVMAVLMLLKMFELLHFFFYLTLSVILKCHIQNLRERNLDGSYETVFYQTLSLSHIDGR